MIRPPQPSSVEPAPQWQTIYCSLVLLLVVFFIMLIAYSTIDKGRFRKIKSAAVEQDASRQDPAMAEAMRSLQQLTDQLGLKGDFSVIQTPTGFKAVVATPVLFDSGDASLNPSVLPALDGIIAIAKRNDLMIQVEGHTDNRPIETAKYPSNWELSTLRAVNILRYFQKNGDIPQSRLAAVGFGEYQPVASNDTAEGRQQNRRIEILFRPGT